MDEEPTTEETEEQFETIRRLVFELAQMEGAMPVRGLWERRLDKRWMLCVNGADRASADWHGFRVPAYGCLVTYNGWPWAVFDAGGGEFGKGAGANMDTFVSALQQALGPGTTSLPTGTDA